MKKLLVSLLLWLMFSSVHAIEPLSCRNGFFPDKQDALQLAMVNIAKGEKLYFYNDDEGCPQSPKCKNKAYLVAGDNVIVNAITDGWACAWFQGKKHETVGWVSAEKLQIKPVDGAEKWDGQWTYYDNTLQFHTKDNKTEVAGEAFWTAENASAEKVVMPDGSIKAERVVHTGSLGGELKINGYHATVSEGEDSFSCHADFTLLGNYLVVNDNNNCGGANVSFSGVYLSDNKKIKTFVSQ